MRLKELLSDIEYTVLCGSADTEISSVIYDSRRVEEGSLFVCLRGANSDGHAYVADAASAGAAAIVIEDESLLPGEDGDTSQERIAAVCGAYRAVDDAADDDGRSLTVIRVADTREALAYIAAAWFGHPGDRLRVIGITGTKGKTTTTYMIRSILQDVGHRVGLIGTIEAIIGDEHIPAHNTTPESYELQEDFAKMLDAGCDICVMEVSSQGLMQHRVDGFTFEIGIFTNIEPDHIGPNEHKDFEDYLHCKSLLFGKCKLGIFNADAEHLDDILRDAKCDRLFYGIESPERQADYLASDIKLWQDGGHLGVSYQVSGRINAAFSVGVPGRFSVYNSLAAIAVCDHFNVDIDAMQRALREARVKGRIELVHVSDDFSLMIDYAHNAMALESLLTALREYQPGRLVTVFGCGGNRDRNRRFEMGEVSGRLSDLTIITSDNPRFEEPEAIIDDIETGIRPTGGSYIKITDRKEAIRYAIEHGKPGDVIVLAGKGHEDYQEIRGRKYPMDERVLIAEVL